MAREDQSARLKIPEDIEIVDKRHCEQLRVIISQIGWPTKSRVGETASVAAWLLVQHADQNPAFQAECLELMKEEGPDEVRPEDIAFLEDRVRANADRPQIYGTQLRESRNERGEVIEYKPLPIEDPDAVDERRKAIGLPLLTDYVRELTERHYPHLLGVRDN